jgi:hypothetical protein
MNDKTRHAVDRVREVFKTGFMAAYNCLRLGRKRNDIIAVVRSDRSFYARLMGGRWTVFDDTAYWKFPGDPPTYGARRLRGSKVTTALDALVTLGFVKSADAELIRTHAAEVEKERNQKNNHEELQRLAKRLHVRLIYPKKRKQQ